MNNEVKVGDNSEICESEPQYRLKGRFCRKRIATWRKNIALASKKRRVEVNSLPAYPLDGRRIVEIEKLALDMWCNTCDQAISFRNVVKETLHGLASCFSVKCLKCESLILVRSSRQHEDTLGKRNYHINSKVAIAMFDGGIGETQLNVVLSALNVPPLNTKVLKRSERIVGLGIEAVAKNSCRDALRIEKDLTIAHENPESSSSTSIIAYYDNLQPQLLSSHYKPLPREFDPSSMEVEGMKVVESSEPIGLTCSYDAGWQKKGSGRSYNSTTGHGTAIAHWSKLCVAYASRNKLCRFCLSGRPKESHDCRLNFSGSSKAMEADMAVEIFTKNDNFVAENVRLKTLIGDEDSSTIANLRRESIYPIEKWTDINHATCKLSKYLYGLKKVSASLVDYFKRTFTTVLRQNKGNVEATRRALLNIVPHSFGEHNNCDSWCKYKEDPAGYTHKRLPGGKPLSGADLRTSLEQIFAQFASSSEKLAPCGSSQGNESLNMVCSSKTSKVKYYGGSSSNDFRIAAAICQKNLGRSFIERVNEQLNLSPISKHSLKFRHHFDRIRKLRASVARTIQFKRRRRQLFNDRSKINTRAENKEGITYESNCAFDAGIDFMDEPTVPSIHSVIDGSTRVVFFDIETTGLRKTDEIIQIAAKMQEKEYNAFIVPTHGIPSVISDLTGLEVRSGEMYLKSARVITTPPKCAVAEFITFLKTIGQSVILAAHNGIRFDAPMFLRFVQRLNMIDELNTVVRGFTDTLPLFKDKMTERKANKQSFSQSVLAGDLLGSEATVGAHDARVDVRILEQLVNQATIKISEQELIDNAKTVSFILKQEHKAVLTKSIRNTLDVLRAEKDTNGNSSKSVGLSAGMITKIARAGITLEHLQQSYLNTGIVGIRLLLGQNIGSDKGVRVTTNKRVVEALAARLEELKSGQVLI